VFQEEKRARSAIQLFSLLNTDRKSCFKYVDILSHLREGVKGLAMGEIFFKFSYFFKVIIKRQFILVIELTVLRRK